MIIFRLPPRAAGIAAVAVLALAAMAGNTAAQITDEQKSALRANCRSDFMAKCSGVTPGGKDALLCLQKNVETLSAGCKTAVSATLPPPAEAKTEPKPDSQPAQAAPAQAPAAAPPAPTPAATATPPAPPPAAAATPPKPQQAATPPAATPKKPTTPSLAPKQAVAAPTTAAPLPASAAPAAEPPVPIERIQNRSLPVRARIARECRGDEDAVCADVKRGQGRLIACLAEHKAALSPNCRQTVENALK